jgi:group I intron endonuclease
MEQEQIPQNHETTQPKKCKGGIYLITNLTNNKVYIGSAISFRNRWKTHKYKLRNDKHDNQHLQRAWNKYGENNFKFEKIRLVKFDTMLVPCEQIYLDLYESYKKDKGYNISPTAGSNLGYRASEETKRKLSIAGKNHSHPKWTKEQKAAHSKLAKRKGWGFDNKNKAGQKLSQDHIQKIIVSLTGNKRSVGRILPETQKEFLHKLNCGENNPAAKLTDIERSEIIFLYYTQPITKQSLATQYGVSETQVGRIINR